MSKDKCKDQKVLDGDSSITEIAETEKKANEAAAEILPKNVTADVVNDSIKADLDNEKNMAKNLENDADSSRKGVDGVKPLFPSSHRGSAKAVPVTNLFRVTRQGAAINAGDFETVIVSDLDKYGQQDRMAAAAYDEIQSVIKHESTKNVESGDTAIIGNPTDTDVYSDESTIVEETITNSGVKEPVASPRHRRIGTEMHVQDGMLNLTGDIISGLNEEDDSNGKKLHSAVYLNKLAANKHYQSIETGKFVAPKLGKYWVRGINPFATTAAGGCLTEITALKNHVIRGYSDWTDAQPGSPVYAHVYRHELTDTNDNLFDVVDLTPFVQNIRAANKKVMSTLTNVKGKMKLGLYEALAKQMDYVVASFEGDADAAKAWPDYYLERKRCTLWDGSRNGNDLLGSQACYNEPESFFRFMEAVRSCEQLALPVMMEGLNDTNSIKFFKGQTGKRNTDPFFDNYSGYSQKQTAIGSKSGAGRDIHGPNMVPYGRYIDSTAAFNTPGKWLFTFRNYKSRVLADLAIINDDPMFDEIKKSILGLSTALQEMIDIFSVGRVVPDEDMTSNALLKIGGNMDIIVDMDPNDLVQSVKNGPDTEWYPSCGYVNILRDDDQRLSRYETFYILPQSIDIIINALKDLRLKPLFCNDLTSATYYTPSDAGNDNLYKWMCGNKQGAPTSRKFIPIRMNSIEGDLYPHFFMECFKISAVSCIKNNVKNGFIRYLRACEKFGFNDILHDYFDVTGTDIFAGVMSNDQLKLNPTWQTPDQFPTLWKSARDRFLDRNNNIIAQLKPGWINKGELGDTTFEILCYEPEDIFKDITNTKGLTFINMKDSTDGATKVIEELIGAHSKDEIMAELSKSKYTKLTVGDLHICTTITVQLGDTKKVSNSEFSALDAKEMSVNQKVMVEGADAEFLNYSDDMANKLYGKDYFFVTPHDAYMVAYTDGRYIDAARQTSAGATFKGNIMLIPVDYLSEDDANATWANGTRCGTATRHAYNANFSETIAVDDVSITVNANDGYGERTDLQKDCLAYRIMCRPSLYGTSRLVPFGATHLNPDWNGRRLDGFISAKTKKTDSFYYSNPLYADFIYAVAPIVQGLNFKASDGTWDWDSAQLPENSREDLGDESFYVSQKLFAGDGWDRTYNGGNSSLANWEFSLKLFLDYCNDPFNVKVYMANAPATDPRVYRDYIIKLNDAMRRFINYRHAGLLSKCVAGNIVLGDASFTQKMMQDLYSMYSDEYLSEQSFNDTRLWHIGKPPVFFDRETRFTGNYKSYMWDNYIKNK